MTTINAIRRAALASDAEAANFLKPAKADALAATGPILRAVKLIIAAESEVDEIGADGPVLVARYVDARRHPAARADLQRCGTTLAKRIRN